MNYAVFVFLFHLIFFCLRNKVDFLLLLFSSFTLYSSHIIFGEITLYSQVHDVFDDTYMIVCIVYFVIFIFTNLYDYLEKKIKFKVRKELFSLHKLYFLFTILSFTLVLVHTIQAGTLNKTELKTVPFLHLFFYYPCSLFLISSIFLKKKRHIVLSLVLFTYCFVISARAFAVISFISVILYINYNKSLLNKRSIKILCFILSIAFLAVFSRYYEKIIFTQDLSSFTETLFILFLSIEFGQICYNLNISTIVTNIDHQFSNIFFSFFPGFKSIFNLDSPRYSGFLYREYNPGFNYGLGGTFWGELYYLGGFVAVTIGAVVLCSIILIVLFFLNRGVRHSPSLILLLGFLCFYVHRCDISLTIGFVKNFIIFSLLFEFLLISLKNSANKITY